MKQIILIMILSSLVSCRQDNNSRATKNLEKENISQTNLKNRKKARKKQI